MTQKQAKEMWPLIKAWSEGKTLQVREYSGGEWLEQEDFNFDREPDDYRIKPEPKLRPWKPEEVPVGALIRTKNGDHYCVQMIISNCSRDGIGIPNESGKVVFHSNAHCLNFEHSLDHGKTWLPCGVIE